MSSRTRDRTSSDPDSLADAVTSITQSPGYAPIEGYWHEVPAGLRLHPGPVAVDTTVWVHGTGRWRPGIVVRVSRRLGVETYTVVHSAPSNPTRMYTKRVQIGDLRLLAELPAIRQAKRVERGELPSGSVVMKVTGPNSLLTPGEVKCDRCHQQLHRDINGYWCGDDDTAECSVDPNGHTVEGKQR